MTELMLTAEELVRRAIYWNVRQVAQHMRVSEDTVRQWTKRHKIPSVKRNGEKQIRFHRVTLLRFVRRLCYLNLRPELRTKRVCTVKPDSEASYATRRARLIRRATPPWANESEIEKLYMCARQLTLENGEPHHVDHEIPLQGRTVCGLHVETNLRVIPAIDNLRRARVFRP